jgi:hypothetical protein
VWDGFVLVSVSYTVAVRTQFRANHTAEDAHVGSLNFRGWSIMTRFPTRWIAVT